MMKKIWLFVFFCAAFSTPVYAQNTVMDNILTRASVRSYQNKAVEDEKITQILKAAMAAPSALNRQPWRFIVVKDAALKSELAKNLPNAKMAEQAPVAIVVCGDMDKTAKGDAKEFWVQDVSAATQNLLLAAHSLELGAVWTGLYPTDRAQTAAKILNLPENLIAFALIPVGYPVHDVLPKDKWDETKISYDKF